MFRQKRSSNAQNSSLSILAFVGRLPKNDTTKVVSRQVLRAATGLGANYRAACRARSRADFVSKIGIALEEADESGFWLELVAESHTVIKQSRLPTTRRSESTQRNLCCVSHHSRRSAPPRAPAVFNPKPKSSINLQSSIFNLQSPRFLSCFRVFVVVSVMRYRIRTRLCSLMNC